MKTKAKIDQHNLKKKVKNYKFGLTSSNNNNMNCKIEIYFFNHKEHEISTKVFNFT